MADVNKWMIDPNDAVMVLIAHQSGLFQLVRDIDLTILRTHVTALAKVAHIARIPVHGSVRHGMILLAGDGKKAATHERRIIKKPHPA